MLVYSPAIFTETGICIYIKQLSRQLLIFLIKLYYYDKIPNKTKEGKTGAKRG
jgi:hypothetical protein